MKTTNSSPYIVGIDVSSEKLDVHILADGCSATIPNKTRSINAFIKKLKARNADVLIAMENTGGCEKLARQLFFKNGINVHLAHATRVYHFAKQKGSFAKTDKIDARIIAQYAEQERVRPTQYDQKSGELQELSNRRAQIVDDLHDEKCRLTRPKSRAVTRSIKRKIKFLEQEKMFIEDELKKQIDSDPDKAEKVKRLQTCKGVGKAIAHGLVALVPELGTLGRAEIAAIMGVAPKNNDSGKKRGQRRIVGGRFNARRLLYMGALVATKYNAPLREFYTRLRDKGKPAKVAITAVMRKMIITLNAMIRDNVDWTERQVVAP